MVLVLVFCALLSLYYGLVMASVHSVCVLGRVKRSAAVQSEGGE